VAALASWLDARAHGGRWLVRMEDLDGPRTRAGSAESILATLAALGLVADEPVQYQSSHVPRYHEALQQLQARGLLYRCTCSRSEALSPYPGTCREANHPSDRPGALRLRFPDDSQHFTDRFQGPVHFAAGTLGDPVLLRRDGIVAYQLAVVVDDLAQGITDVVRGADLLASTPWQLAIIEALGGTPPRYAHVPLVTGSDGRKLSKSRCSLLLDTLSPSRELMRALSLLGQQPPDQLAGAAPAHILEWACQHWEPKQLGRRRYLALPSP